MPTNTTDEVQQGSQETQGDAFISSRHAAIEPLWQDYLTGRYTSVVEHVDKVVELVPSSDLGVRKVIDPANGSVISVDVWKQSNFLDLNFMGFEPEQRCFAFRGEARLFGLFLSFTTEIIKDERVLAVCKALAEVRVAGGGIPGGLSYEEFAGHVEVIEYGMWLKDPATDSHVGELQTVPIAKSIPNCPDSDQERQEEVHQFSEADVTSTVDPAPADTSCMLPAAQYAQAQNSFERYPLRRRSLYQTRQSSLPAETARAFTPKPIAKKRTQSDTGKNTSTKAKRGRR